MILAIHLTNLSNFLIYLSVYNFCQIGVQNDISERVFCSKILFLSNLYTQHEYTQQSWDQELHAMLTEPARCSKKSFFCFFFKLLCIYSWETHRERQRHRKRKEKQAPHREPNVGLHPRTSGSQPEMKADAGPLSHPGVPPMKVFLRALFNC